MIAVAMARVDGHDQGGQGVGHHVAHEHPGRRGARRSRGGHEVGFAQGQQAAAQEAGEDRGVGDPDREHDLDLAVAKGRPRSRSPAGSRGRPAGRRSMRIRTVSTLPPLPPASAPMVTPKTRPKATATTPTTRLSRAPYRIRLNSIAPEQVGPHEVGSGSGPCLLSARLLAEGSYGARIGANTAPKTKIAMNTRPSIAGPLRQQSPECIPPQSAAGPRCGPNDDGAAGGHLRST